VPTVDGVNEWLKLAEPLEIAPSPPTPVLVVQAASL
jgi:hypothetical protein